MKKTAFLFLSILIFVSCRQIHKDPNSEANQLLENDSILKIEDHLKEVYHRFPSPEEMLAVISIEKNDFNLQMLNSTEKISHYLDSRSQAINLGVYIADLAYVSMLKQHTESVKYFEVIYELSDNLRISSAFDRALMLRIQENISNADSLKLICEVAFNSLSNYLESTDNEKIFALISLGGFVEALYLSLNFIEVYDEDNMLIQRIADQKFVFDNIISFSKQFENDISVAGAIEDLRELQLVFDGLTHETTETIVTRDSEGKLLVSGGKRLLITEEEFVKLKQVTINTRKKITQN